MGFRRPKTPDEYTNYIAVIGLTVGLSNGLRTRRNLAGGLHTTQQHRMPTVIPFREHFYVTYKIIFRRCRGRVRVCLGSERTTERTGGTRTDASFEKHADEMQMMTWKNATRKQMTWQQRRITGRHLAHHIRGVTHVR